MTPIHGVAKLSGAHRLHSLGCSAYPPMTPEPGLYRHLLYVHWRRRISGTGDTVKRYSIQIAQCCSLCRQWCVVICFKEKMRREICMPPSEDTLLLPIHQAVF